MRIKFDREINHGEWNCNKKFNLENHLKKKERINRRETEFERKKKLKERGFENNFQFQIINWNKRNAINYWWIE